MKRVVIKEGFSLLRAEKNYNQLTVIQKLRYLGCDFAEATYSNILTEKNVSQNTLSQVAEAIQKLIAMELDHVWQEGAYRNQNTANWQPLVVRETTSEVLSIVLNPGFVFHAEGRLTTQQKVEFFTKAQREVVEFGLTLNTFVSYFKSRKDTEYKTHIEALLKRGVNFKCYMLDPECNEASVYFEDRRREQEDEIKNIDTMRDVARLLGLIKRNMDEAKHPGKFEVFTYKHIPYNYCMAVDGSTPNGSMMVSHYMYALPRAKTPVLEFTKSNNQDLFQRYWFSLQKLMKGAKPILCNQPASFPKPA